MVIRAKSGWGAAIRLAILILLAAIIGIAADQWHIGSLVTVLLVGALILQRQRTLSIPPGQIVGLFVAVLVLHAVVVMTFLILNQHRF
jgi:hypothetical protein